MIYGEVHNAKKVTFDGRDFWIGCLMDNGRAILSTVSGPDVSTKEEAIEWCKAEGRRRGYGNIEVREQRLW